MKKLFALVAAALASGAVLAESADRDKPTNIEADRVTVDDRNKVHIFQGKVTLTQGTTQIAAEKVSVTQDTDGYQKIVAAGGESGLARFRTKRDQGDGFLEGEAERIEHDGHNEQTSFINRAYVKSGEDELRGQYVRYDGLTENFVVTNAPGAKSVPSEGDPSMRVRAVIQPKTKDGEAGGASQDTAKP